MSKKENDSVTSGFKTRRVLLIVLCVFLSLVLIALVAAAIWLQSMLGMVGEVDNSQMSESEYQEFLENETEETLDPTFTGETLSPEDILKEQIEQQIIPHENVVNIMLIGQDRREGEGRQRSDSMILCTINYATGDVNLTSFMRDMYVKIPGYSSNRLNVCYVLGGAQLLSDCLKQNFGVVVDGSIEIDFGGFMDVIDTLGGVDMELTEAEANYLNRRGNWDVDDSTAWQWSLVPGMNHLTGEQALAYSRIRYVGNGDFGRTERQRKVLMSVFDACKTKGLGDLVDLMYTLLPLMATDMEDKELVSFALDAITMMSDIEIDTQRIPVDGTYRDAYVEGVGSVLIPNLEANREALSDIIS